jgi:hypothetical protein
LNGSRPTWRDAIRNDLGSEPEDRETPYIDDDREVAILNHDERTMENLLVFSRDASVRGGWLVRPDEFRIPTRL